MLGSSSGGTLDPKEHEPNPRIMQITADELLVSLPHNRLRVATDWVNDVVEHRQFVRLGLVSDPEARLKVAEPSPTRGVAAR
jgi:hypothetical protein